MSKTALLISIRPRFADLIFNDQKHVELRRRRPRVGRGDLVFVYVSSPIKALIGAFEIGEVIEKSPGMLWRKLGEQTGLTRMEFNDYFKEKTIGFGLIIARSWRLPAPVKLSSLRKRRAGFHPPQAYHYFPLTELNRLGGLTEDSAR